MADVDDRLAGPIVLIDELVGRDSGLRFDDGRFTALHIDVEARLEPARIERVGRQCNTVGVFIGPNDPPVIGWDPISIFNDHLGFFDSKTRSTC